jgi:hypothetical protein
MGKEPGVLNWDYSFEIESASKRNTLDEDGHDTHRLYQMSEAQLLTEPRGAQKEPTIVNDRYGIVATRDEHQLIPCSIEFIPSSSIIITIQNGENIRLQ